MLTIDSYVHTIVKIVTSFSFLLFVFIAALVFKIGILIKLLLHKKHAKASSNQLMLLLLTIGTAILINATWILKTADKLFVNYFDQRVLLFCVRITWAILTLHYHSLALFIESLVKKKQLLKSKRQKFLMPISASLFFFFLLLAGINFNSTVRPKFELLLLKLVPYYYLFCILLVSLLVSLFKFKSHAVPRLLKKQFYIFMRVLFLPIAISEFIHFYPIKSLYIEQKYIITALSISLLTYALHVCLKKIIWLRFLNLKGHVQTKKESKKDLIFVSDFKNMLDKLSNITNTRELVHITKRFFRDALCIPIQKTHLYIRNIKGKENYDQYDQYKQYTQDESTIEAFFSTIEDASEIKKIITKEKILIYDELTFSNFYKEEKARKKLIAFLNHLNADIFIPIYENHKQIAYILIERFAREQTEHKHREFYSSLERDQMILFANYLGKFIHMMNTKNVHTILQYEKELEDALYIRKQEITQYKESIRSFLKNGKEKKIGILFYKNRIFTPVNQTAQSLIPINLNTHSGHPIAKAIKKIANQVIEYKLPQTCIIKNMTGDKLIISGIPNIEKNNVIITVRYPEISDIIKDTINLLKNPTLWEYLLYLETTDFGQLIHNFIPAYSEILINSKVSLLRAALNKKAVLLRAPDQDVLSIVNILHSISQRETLEVLEIKKNYNNFEIPIKLFGAHAILGSKQKEKPLLKKLDKTGTLFIKNINLMDQETQNYLAEYMIYGTYREFKGHNREKSNVRLICSSQSDLRVLVEDGTFSQELYNELNKNLVVLPPIHSLPEEEINQLATNIAKQAIKTDEFHHILELTVNEKKRIIKSTPESIRRLRSKIKQILIKKSEKQSIYDETTFDPAYNITDPEIIEAARLGKHALRDPKIMTMLWNKFKSQNKIALLLGVNRSSVNRRFKEYNIF